MYNELMYIFEFITKLIRNRKNKISQDDMGQNEYEECKHIFLPVDSTGEILACSKCGVIVKADELNTMPKNPFN